MPTAWPLLYRELAYYKEELPNVAGVAHNALNDAISTIEACKALES